MLRWHASRPGNHRRPSAATAAFAVVAVCGAMTANGAVAHAAPIRGTGPVTVYVTDSNPGTVSLIDAATTTVSGSTSVDKPGIGVDPEYETATPDGSQVYVVDAIGADVTVIDAAGRKVAATIPLCADPNNVSPLVFTPDGSKAYTTCAGPGIDGRHIYQIDTATHAVSEIVRPDWSRILEASPDSTRLYAVHGDNLAILDTTTHAILATIPTGGSPNALVVSPDGSTVYTGDNTGVSVIDTATDAVRARIPISGGAGSLAATPDGSKLYAAGTTATVTVVSTATDTVTATLPDGSAGSGAGVVKVSPDGATAYASIGEANSQAGQITAIDTATDTVRATVPLTAAAAFFEVSPDSGRVFVGTLHTIDVIDAATDTLVRTLPIDADPGDMVFADHGGEGFVMTGSFAATLGADAVWVLSAANGGVVTTIAPTRQRPSAIVLTPNGATAYIVGRGAVLALNTATRAVHVIPARLGVSEIAMSPDGSRVYAADAADSRVIVIDTGTNTIAESFDVPYSTKAGATVGPRPLAVSPDGSRLYVADQSHVSVVDTSTDKVVGRIPVPGADGGLSALAVSPDGSLAYVTNGANGTVSVIAASTDTLSGSITVGTDPDAVAFSPDGTRAYVANRASTGTVSVIDTSTASVTATIAVGQYPRALAVTPDGGQVYVADFLNDAVSVIATATGTVTTLTVGGWPDGVAISS